MAADIKSRLQGFTGDRGEKLTYRHECNVGTPYANRDGHNQFVHVPNGKAGGPHEHIFQEDSRRTEA